MDPFITIGGDDKTQFDFLTSVINCIHLHLDRHLCVMSGVRIKSESAVCLLITHGKIKNCVRVTMIIVNLHVADLNIQCTHYMYSDNSVVMKPYTVKSLGLISPFVTRA